MSLPDGLKAYPDRAKLDTAAQDGTIVGTREQDVALIAQKPGHYELPAMRLTWWDSRQNAAREATLPARTLDILAAEGTGTTAMGATSATPSSTAAQPEIRPSTAQASTATSSDTASVATRSRLPWQWISLVLAILWFATLLAWWRQNRRIRTGMSSITQAPAESQPDLKSVLAACRSGKPAEARQALIGWARQRWPEHPPLGLKDLAQRFADSRITGLLQDLDRACYRGGNWNGEALAEALADAGSRRALRTNRDADRSELAALYP
jgi:hypothetical protein